MPYSLPHPFPYVRCTARSARDFPPPRAQQDPARADGIRVAGRGIDEEAWGIVPTGGAGRKGEASGIEDAALRTKNVIKHTASNRLLRDTIVKGGAMRHPQSIALP